MSDNRELTLLVKSRFPIIVIETHEEARALALLENVCNLESQPLFAWSVASGLRRRGRNETMPQTSDPHECLRHIDKTLQNGVYALLDFHPFLEDPVHQRLIREIALAYNKTARTLVFVSPKLELPATLARMSARMRLTLLDADGVRQIIREEVELWKRDEGADAQAHAGDAKLDMAILTREMEATRPLSVTMSERIDALRAWAAGRTVPAN